MVVETPLMTVEAFWERYGGKPFELVHGKVVAVSPSGMRASAIAAYILIKLGGFLETHPLGIVTGADGGYRLDGITLRAPDVAFLSSDKVALHTQPEMYVPFAPDLVVEVVSPNDGALEVLEKAELYLDAEVSQVWVVYPELKRVVVHYPDKSTRLFTVGDTLEAGNLLPGFHLALADIFAVMP